MHATQKVIAQRLGVSVSLVSRALRGEGARIGASPETIRCICEEAARCGYVPNFAALSLRDRTNLLLGVVVRDFADPFFGPLLGALQQLAAEEPACSLVMTGSGVGDHSPFSRYRFNGYILMGSDFQPAGYDRWTHSSTPVVRLGEGPAEEQIAQVRVAHALGFAELLRYLRGLGHRRIGYLGNGTPTSARRADLLQRELKQAGLPAPPDAFVTLPDSQTGTLVAVTRAMMRSGVGRVTALVTASDVLALTLLRALHESGVHVPRDLSVVGLDDIPFASLAVPALTTLRPPIAAMAKLAFALSIGRTPMAASARLFDVQPELVVRESCAPPPEKQDDCP